MKVAPSAYQKNYHSTKKPLLPLVPVEGEELTKGNSIGFELHSDPANADSPKFKIQVRILTGNEDVHSIVEWYKDRITVLARLNVTTYGPAVAMTETLMKGVPLATFRQALQAGKDLAMRNAAQAASDAAIGDAAAKQAAYDAVINGGTDAHQAMEQVLQAVQYAL